MKVLWAACFLFLLTTGGLSQIPAAGSDLQMVAVIEKKWSFEVRNPLLDEDPLQPIKDTEQEIRDRREERRQEALRAKMGLPPEPRQARVKPPEAEPQQASASYIYEAKFKNNGEKAIQILFWDYIFLDPQTKAEVGRRRFETKVNIAPGKTKSVSMRSVSPPTGTISAAQASKKEQYIEQVIIQGILYADGSAWKSPEILTN